MDLSKLVEGVSEFHNMIAYLKTVALIYPNIYYLEKDNILWGTTLVEFEYEGVKYRRHHVDSIRLDFGDGVNIENLNWRLQTAAELCIKHGKPLTEKTNIRHADGSLALLDDIVKTK